MIIDGVFIGFYIVPIIVFLVAVGVAIRRFQSGDGLISVLLGFMLAIAFGAVVCIGLLVLYATLYYAGGGH